MSVSPPAGERPMPLHASVQVGGSFPEDTLLGSGRVVKWAPPSVDFQAKVPPHCPPMTQNTFSDEP